MPVKSAKQFRFMQAAAHGKVNTGPSRKVAEEFLKKTSQAKKKEFARSK